MAIPAARLADLRASDQFLISFPRSGNTWLRYLLREAILLSRPGLPPLESLLEILPAIHNATPVRERHAEFGLPGRLIKSHNLADLPGVRMVYLFREPADALASLVHFRIRRAAGGLSAPVQGTLDENCLRLLPEWCEHLQLAIARHRALPGQSHFVAYEAMHRETVGVFADVAAFLGVKLTGAHIARAVEQCHFAHLQKSEQERAGKSDQGLFFRKGRVGGGAEELRPDTLHRIESAGRDCYDEACRIAAGTA